jgi:hypothetical protein
MLFDWLVTGHDVADYLARIRAMQREFRRLAANP